MCGIAGIIGTEHSQPIINMVGAMHNRGPDDSGTWSDSTVHLGMARLSIQDLSMAGHQPMFSPDGRYIIVFNGEVYNYQELKDQFYKGEEFVSSSDTEVILKMYAQMGAKCLQHFRGMFALLIWDTHEKKLFGARDRMGIKPLLYYHNQGKLLLASELKAMLASLNVPFEVEEKAVADLFLYGSVQFNKSFVKGVFSVPPATYFEYKPGDTHIEFKNYWEFPSKVDNKISFDEAKEKFTEIYKESVRLRMISDRKVGVFLSGGMDSVSILANLRSQNISNIRSFTIGFEEEHHKFKSEIAQAKKLSQHFGYENDSINIGFNDVKPYWDEFILGLDQPSVDGLNTFLVSKYSKEFLTVSLSGLGGDELMMGYPRNVNLYNLLSQRAKPLGSLSDWYLKNKFFNGIFDNKYIGYLFKLVGGSSNLEMNYMAWRFLNTPHALQNKFNPKHKNLFSTEIINDFFSFGDEYKSNLINRISYYEVRSFMLSQLLRDMDAVSMSQSIEVRFPLIDHKIVEFLFSIPAEYKYNKQGLKSNHQTGKMTYEASGVKHLLAEAYKKDFPAGYLKTPKQGFQLPVLEWASKIFANNLGDIISSDYMYDIFDREYINEAKNNFAKTQVLDINTYLLAVYSMWYQSMQDLVSKYKSKVPIQ